MISPIVKSNESFDIYLNSPLERDGPKTHCIDEICTSLLRLINGAKSSIDFAIYGLRGQHDILDALKEAEKRGIAVRGIIVERCCHLSRPSYKQ